MPAKPAIYKYDYRKVTTQISTPQYEALTAYCGVTRVDGKVLKPGQMARHLLLKLVPKGEEILKKVKG